MPFEALENAIALVSKLQPVLQKIRRRDPGLCDQAQRAAQDHALALSEGGSRTGREEIRFWRAALGSITELRDALRISLASGYVGDADLVEVAPLVDRGRAMAWRLVHPKPHA